MEPYEFEGKSAEEAIKNACRQLNLTAEEMEIEIIEPGSAGIFGLVGGRKAKIKVTIAKQEAEFSEEEDGLSVAKEALEKILALIPMEETTVTARQSNGRISLNIEGDKSGLLIGRKGRTLDALQYIVTRIANKTLEKKIRIAVDSENYRKRREDSLTQIALRMGDKAKKIGKPVSTNLLSPHERRIIHLTLRGDQDLNTKSLGGEGLLKKVIIIPRKNSIHRTARFQ